MMYDNMKNEVNTNERMEYIQMKDVTRSKIHIRHSPHWQMGPSQFIIFLLKIFTLSVFYIHIYAIP